MEEQIEIYGIKMIRRRCANKKCPLSFLVSENDTKTTHHSAICKANDVTAVKSRRIWNEDYRHEKGKNLNP